MEAAAATIPLVSIGRDAARVLRAGARGKVAAVFDHSLYARFGEDWICLGDASIGNGPLNGLVPGAAFARWRERVRMEDWVEVSGSGGGAWRIRPDEALAWRAPLIGPSSSHRIRLALEELQRRLPAGIPDEGLACFIWSPANPESPVAQAALSPVRAASDWIAVRDREVANALPEKLARLIGLGPGLTPSGDDFLAGVLATLRRLERHEQADALWRLIAPLAAGRTHPISIAHLRAAARGGLCEAPHGLLEALLGHADWPALDCWPDLGHSSPWDALAGVATVLRASVSALERSDSAHGD